LITVDFPDPVAPTIATFSPLAIVRSRSRSTGAAVAIAVPASSSAAAAAAITLPELALGRRGSWFLIWLTTPR